MREAVAIQGTTWVAMRTVFRERGFKFLFSSNEGSPREPIHMHAEKDGVEAKFWLRQEVNVADNDGYNARVLRELLGIVESNTNLIEREWIEYFG